MTEERRRLTQELLHRKMESEDLDYKETIDLSTPKGKAELAKDLAAFANTKGGHLLYGVRDPSFQPVGVNIDEINKTKIHQIAGSIHPSVHIYSEFVELKGLDFLLLTIEKDNRVHETKRGTVPYRNGDTTEYADAGQIAQMKNLEHQNMLESFRLSRRELMGKSPIRFIQSPSYKESVFEIVGVSNNHLALVGNPTEFRILLPHKYKFWFLQEVSVDRRVRLQVGADCKITYCLERDIKFDYVGLKIMFLLYDGDGNLVARNSFLDDQLVALVSSSDLI